MSEPDKRTWLDFETFDGYYRIERSYWCETKQRRCWEPVSPDQILAVIELVDLMQGASTPKAYEEYGARLYKAMKELKEPAR